MKLIKIFAIVLAVLAAALATWATDATSQTVSRAITCSGDVPDAGGAFTLNCELAPVATTVVAPTATFTAAPSTFTPSPVPFTSTPIPFTPTPTATPAPISTSTPVTLTPTPTPNPTLNSLASIIADMTQPHQGCLDTGAHGVTGFDWQFMPRVKNQKPPAGWSAEDGWGTTQTDFCSGPNDFSNVRVQIRRMRTYLLLASGTWQLVRSQNSTPDGGQFWPNYIGGYQLSANTRNESEGWSVRPLSGYSYHWYPWRAIVPVGVVGIYSTYEARLIPDHAGTMSTIHLLAASGADWWQTLASGTGTEAGFGRFKKLTPDWQPFDVNTVPSTTLLANPPPLQ